MSVCVCVCVCVCSLCVLRADRPKRHKVYPSGSEDSGTYLSLRLRRSNGLMSMNKTLALLYLGLLWCREALTLADLLR